MGYLLYTQCSTILLPVVFAVTLLKECAATSSLRPSTAVGTGGDYWKGHPQLSPPCPSQKRSIWADAIMSRCRSAEEGKPSPHRSPLHLPILHSHQQTREGFILPDEQMWDFAYLLCIQVKLKSDVSMPDSLFGCTKPPGCFWWLQGKEPQFTVL